MKANGPIRCQQNFYFCKSSSVTRIPLHNVFHNYVNALIILGNIVIRVIVANSISSIV